MLNSFWWGKNNSSGLHWLSWERLSVPKDCGGMSFKSLQAFNFAMLGKQAWKLVTNPDALITKLLKAKYFSDSDFFHSRIGHNPSYVWRSICSAKFVVQGGSKWNVGTGDCIDVWNQNWIKSGGSLTPLQHMPAMLEHLKVSHIIRHDVKAWNHNLIQSLFDNNTAGKILDTHLFSSVRKDELVWHLEKGGVYSVRSAYKYCVNETGIIERHGLDGSWAHIWRIKIPPKVKGLLWRIARNCLPTRMRLVERGVPYTTQCACCNNEFEDSNHIFFLCPRSAQCWQKCGLWDTIEACIDPVNSITSNLFLIIQKLDEPQLEFFSVMLWGIWKRRNNQVWENITELSQTVWDRAHNMLMSWRNAQHIRNSATMPRQESPVMSWTKPPTARYKCNIDASFSSSDNKAGIGICIRNDHGSFVLAKTEWIEPILDVEIGEALGLLKALNWVNELHLLNTDFEIDCKRVVDSLYSKKYYASNSVLYSMIVDTC